MGSLVGHVLPGFGFFVIGLWHLLNLIKLHALNPSNYTSLPWFPTSKMRYLELFFIMGGSSISVAMELFIGPDRHQPLDPDGSIPSNHLRNFEHSSISVTFFIYAAFAILLDRSPVTATAQDSLTQLLGAIAFAQELILFHLHSTDHMGVEGQYHLLFQSILIISLLTTLMGIGYPNSFINGFMRSLSILFQGVWLMVMGIMLWTPALIPEGCFINSEDDHQVVRCHSDKALRRARSLVNIQFSWCLIFVTIFSVSLYLCVSRIYVSEKLVVDYHSLSKFQLEQEEDEDENEDVEAQHSKKTDHAIGADPDESKSFIDMGKSYAPLDMEM